MRQRSAAAALLVVGVGLFLGADAPGIRLGSARADGLSGAVGPGDSASYASHGKPIGVEVFRPAGDGKLPALLYLHGADCLQSPLINAGYRLNARRLARAGYVVLLVHYMESTGNKTTNPVDMARNFQTWLQTIRDAIGYAESRKDVVRNRIGVLGASLGATLALCVGAADERVSAVVENFGALPDSVAPMVKRMPPVLILHGDADRLVNVKEAYKLERVLKEKGLKYEMHIYPGQGHGFFGAAAEDSAERTIVFLNRHLKALPTSSPGT